MGLFGDIWIRECRSVFILRMQLFGVLKVGNGRML